MDVQKQLDEAYEICKLQAQVDGAFDERLMRSWFAAAWKLCEDMEGLIPPTEITEPIVIRPDGSFRLSHQPTSEVKLYSGYTLILVLPPTLERTRCDPSLCCFCRLTAKYMIGQETCEVSPLFIQAVARVFAYICENRGDTLQAGGTPGEILKDSGAMAFLNLTYVA